MWTNSCKAWNTHVEFPSWGYKYTLRSSMAINSIQRSWRRSRGQKHPREVSIRKKQKCLVLGKLNLWYHYWTSDWDLYKKAAVWQTIFSNQFSGMKIIVFWVKFHWNLLQRAKQTMSQHLFKPVHHQAIIWSSALMSTYFRDSYICHKWLIHCLGLKSLCCLLSLAQL